ncbi:MAG: glycosyltransferase family 2 protein [Candidatus Hydrogenedentales bacterium]
MTKRVLVIIPAYNEEETIASVVASLREHAPDFDILVIDDGSTDDTAKVVRELGGVELVRLPFNLGIGSAVQTGFKYALRQGYDVAVQCDADGQHPVAQLKSLVDHLEKGGADMVIGSRYVSPTAYVPSWSRRVGKSLLSRLVNIAIGGGITDTTSGFRALNRRALRVLAKHYPDDYPEAEALVILHRSGLRAVEIPVDMQPRQGGSSSIKPVHAAYYMVKVAMAICIDRVRRFTHISGEP